MNNQPHPRRLPRTGATRLLVALLSTGSFLPAFAQGDSNDAPAQVDCSKTPEPAQHPFSGSYQSTLNGSALGQAKPSLGHRLILSYAPKLGGSIDSRFEYYVDGSYNSDAPGRLLHNINEPKFEGQVMYGRRLSKGLGAGPAFAGWRRA